MTITTAAGPVARKLYDRAVVRFRDFSYTRAVRRPLLYLPSSCASRFKPKARRAAEAPAQSVQGARFFAAYSFTRGGVLNTITARLANATDRLYRNHLNYLKDVLPEIGRSFRWCTRWVSNYISDARPRFRRVGARPLFLRKVA